MPEQLMVPAVQSVVVCAASLQQLPP